MRNLTKRRVLVVLLGLAEVFAVFLGIKSISDRGGQSPFGRSRVRRRRAVERGE